MANNPGFCAIPVAGHAIMGMLTLLRYGAYSHFELMRGNWVQKEVDYKLREINGKTVGILGLGSVGIEVAKRLKGFNVKILYNKRNRIDSETEQRVGRRIL